MCSRPPQIVLQTRFLFAKNLEIILVLKRRNPIFNLRLIVRLVS